jgi:hypothetical protein
LHWIAVSQAPLSPFHAPQAQEQANSIRCSLASSELYVTIAKLFGGFDMKLFDTDEDDIKQVHDFFSPFPASERGLRVTIE